MTLALTVLVAAPPAAAGEFQVVARGGDRSPDDSGDLSSFGNAVIQRRGEAVFAASVTENGFVQSSDLFRAGPQPGQLSLLAKQGAPAPDANGNFGSFNGEIPYVNNAGAIAFGVFFENTLAGFVDLTAILTRRAGGPLQIAVRSNQLTPGGDRFGVPVSPFAFNDAGQVGFTSLTRFDEVLGIWRVDTPSGAVVRIVGQGDPTPAGDGILFGGASGPGINVMNEAGEVAWYDIIDDGDDFLGTILRGTRFDRLVEIAREGDATPTGNGIYEAFSAQFFPQIEINDRGDVAFSARLVSTQGGLADDFAIFRGNGSRTVEIARKGETAPDGNGRFLDPGLAGHLILNSRREVLFASSITGATNGSSSGLFLGGVGGRRVVMRLNAPAPGGGTFAALPSIYALNNAGQVVFRAVVDVGQFSSIAGLFLYEAGTLSAIVREGDVIPGLGTVTGLVTTTGLQGESRAERSLLNDLGQVTFRVGTNGGPGIVVWTPDSLGFVDGFEWGGISAGSNGRRGVQA
ncbi:MAG: choice-of-anchor tandem repeat NxxGxxAF-containing protein, partial [Acidobacteriota bacterium]